MSVEALLSELDRRGIEVVAAGDRIRYRPASRVGPDLLAWLRASKPELLRALAADPWARRAAALLATVADPDRRADLRELFEHRAGVCEFDGNLSRDDAERFACGELRAAMRRVGYGV